MKCGGMHLQEQTSPAKVYFHTRIIVGVLQDTGN